MLFVFPSAQSLRNDASLESLDIEHGRGEAGRVMIL
jgi:hypothetical protein